MSASSATVLGPGNLWIEYPPEKFNLLLPNATVFNVSPFIKPAVSIVKVDPNPANKEVYSVGGDDKSKVFAISSGPLNMMGVASGISWDGARSMWGSPEPHRLVYTAVGTRRGPDGMVKDVGAIKEIDLHAIAEELKENVTKKAKYGFYESQARIIKPYYPGAFQAVDVWKDGKRTDKTEQRYFINLDSLDKYAEDEARSQLIQWKKNRMMRAETSARLRGIRQELGIRSSYTAEDLLKPFAVVRWDLAPDYNDPLVRQIFLQQAAQGMSGLFGSSARPLQIQAPAPQYTPQLSTPVYSEPDYEEPEHTESVTHDPAPVQDPKVEPEILDPVTSTSVEQPPSGGSDTPPNVCADCGRDNVAEKTQEFSRKKFGFTVCYQCQQTRKGGAQG